MRSSGTLVIGLLMSEMTEKEETRWWLWNEGGTAAQGRGGEEKRELKTVPGKHGHCFRS